jgi:hypothetical protein
MTSTSLLVIELYNKVNSNDYAVEWGLSFDGHNPEPENYFQMIDEETAFRLKEKLSTKFPPITRDKPIRCPVNE